MLFFDAAAWSSFGLILAVLIAFIVHYYWKKNKEPSAKKPVPTSDGYDNLKFQEVLDENEEIKEKLEKEKQEHHELKIDHAALQEREKSLNSLNQTLTNELNQLREKREFLQTQNKELEKETAELTQQVVTKGDQLKERCDRIMENKKEMQNLNVYIDDLEENLKKLEIDNKRLSTEKSNLSNSNDRLEKELEKFKGDLRNLQEERTQLLKDVTGLTHEKQKYLEEKEEIKEQYQKSWELYEELRNRGISVQANILEGYKRFKEEHEELVKRVRAEEEAENNPAVGKRIEVWWGEEARKLFSKEDSKFVEFEGQPGNNLDGDRGDFRITFRDNVNSFNSRRQLNIYIEHKHANKQGERIGDKEAEKHPQMNKDLKKAIENIKKSRDDRKYDFLFFITNRDIGKEEFREKQFYLLETDEDYRYFGLDAPRFSYDKELKIVILTGKKALKCLWSLYMLWRLWMPKDITSSGERVTDEAIAKLDKFLGDSAELHDSVSAQMIAKWIAVRKKIDSVVKFWSNLESDFKNMSVRATDLRSKFSSNVELQEVEVADFDADTQSKISTPQLTVVTKGEEEEILIPSQTVKDNSVSEINSRMNMEQSEVRDSLSGNR